MGEKIFCGIVIAAVLALSLYNLLIAVLGAIPGCKATAVGTLKRRRTRRNVLSRHGHIIPAVTDYTYEYTVKGKPYSYKSFGYFTKGHLHEKVTMV